MSLVKLPTELVTAIFRCHIDGYGLHQTTRMRGVCSRFNACILAAIHSHLEVDHGSEPNITGRDYQMGEAMTVRLILTRLETGNSDKRPLCVAIDRAAEYMVYEGSGRISYEDCVKDLAIAASRAMVLPAVLRALSPCPTVPDENIDLTVRDAAIAAVYSQDVIILKSLLGQTDAFSGKTRYFGDLLPVAASIGSLSLVQNLINSINDKKIKPLSKDGYRMEAFTAAAMNGQTSLVIALMRLKGFVNNPSHAYDHSIEVAIKSKHESLSILLLRCRKRIEGSLDWEDTFWENLVLTAARSGKVRIVEHILKVTPISQETRKEAIIIACQYGFTDVLRVLLPSYTTEPTRRFWYPDALYWAGRRGDQEIGSMLLEHRPVPISMNILNIMAGASGSKNEKMFSYALRKHPALSRVSKDELSEIAASQDLRRAVALFTGQSKEESSSSSDEQSKTLSQSDYSIAEDTLENAQHVILMREDQSVSPQDRIRWAKSFQSHLNSACKDQPGILSYLLFCSRWRNFPINGDMTSIALFQVYLDYGWDINSISTKVGGTSLACVLHNEPLTEWHLEHGADPNAPGRGFDSIFLGVLPLPSYSFSVIKLLLKYGAYVRNGHSPHHAVQCRNNTVEMVQLLIDLGCDVNELGED